MNHSNSIDDNPRPISSILHSFQFVLHATKISSDLCQSDEQLREHVPKIVDISTASRCQLNEFGDRFAAIHIGNGIVWISVQRIADLVGADKAPRNVHIDVGARWRIVGQIIGCVQTVQGDGPWSGRRRFGYGNLRWTEIICQRLRGEGIEIAGLLLSHRCRTCTTFAHMRIAFMVEPKLLIASRICQSPCPPSASMQSSHLGRSLDGRPTHTQKY